MIKKITLDKLMKTDKVGKIGKISKKIGDNVKMGDKILQVESLKGNTIIKSKVNGTIKLFIVEEGSKVKIGDILVEIEEAA